MVVLQGSHIMLRPLELNDLSFLYAIENDKSLWELSQTKTAYSKDILQKYLEPLKKKVKILSNYGW